MVHTTNARCKLIGPAGLEANRERVATVLRRPHLLRWIPYNEECLEILSSAEDALPSDAWLCQIIRAEHIVEEVHFQFSMDDPMSSVSLLDRNTEAYVKFFEKKMVDWRAKVTPDMPAGKHNSLDREYADDPSHC